MVKQADYITSWKTWIFKNSVQELQMPQKNGRAKLLFVMLVCAKLNLLRSLFSYIKRKYITLTVSPEAYGGETFIIQITWPPEAFV